MAVALAKGGFTFLGGFLAPFLYAACMLARTARYNRVKWWRPKQRLRACWTAQDRPGHPDLGPSVSGSWWRYAAFSVLDALHENHTKVAGFTICATLLAERANLLNRYCQCAPPSPVAKKPTSSSFGSFFGLGRPAQSTADVQHHTTVEPLENLMTPPELMLFRNAAAACYSAERRPVAEGSTTSVSPTSATSAVSAAPSTSAPPGTGEATTGCTVMLDSLALELIGANELGIAQLKLDSLTGELNTTARPNYMFARVVVQSLVIQDLFHGAQPRYGNVLCQRGHASEPVLTIDVETINGTTDVEYNAHARLAPLEVVLNLPTLTAIQEFLQPLVAHAIAEPKIDGLLDLARVGRALADGSPVHLSVELCGCNLIVPEDPDASSAVRCKDYQVVVPPVTLSGAHLRTTLIDDGDGDDGDTDADDGGDGDSADAEEDGDDFGTPPGTPIRSPSPTRNGDSNAALKRGFDAAAKDMQDSDSARQTLRGSIKKLELEQEAANLAYTLAVQRLREVEALESHLATKLATAKRALGSL